MTDRQSDNEILNRAFGSDLPFIKSNRTETFRRLKSREWKERFAALLLLERHWELEPDILLPLCENVISNDPEPQLIGFSMAILGRAKAGTFDLLTSRKIAEIGMRNFDNKTICKSAYLSLLEINQDPPTDIHSKIERISSRIDPHRAHPLEPITKEFFDQYLDRAGA